MCKTSGQCDDSDPYERQIGYLNAIDGIYTKPLNTKLSIKGRGNYPSWMRNGLVEVIVAAAKVNKIVEWHRDVHWSANTKRSSSSSTTSALSSTIFRHFDKRETPFTALPNGVGNVAPTSGSCDVAAFSSHIGLNVYSAPDTLMAFMEATIELPEIDEQKGGFCALKPIAALGSAMGGIVGAPGTLAGGLFGTISAACGGRWGR